MSSRPLRVGSVPYLVGRPLDAGLEGRAGIELVRAVPSRLVAGLRDGSLDAALVSSIELFRRPGYRYVPDLCVAGDGPVSSVRMFLARPLAAVRTVALDPASRTSAALVQCLAPELGLEASFEEPADGGDPRAAGADAWLRIGDAALFESLAEPELPFVDPAATWRAATGLPFVFALWICAPSARVAGRLDEFRRSREHGRAAAATAARLHAERTGLPLAAVERYLLEECVYEVGSRLEPSLRAFRDRAAALGLCEGTLEPEPLEPLDGSAGAPPP